MKIGVDLGGTKIEVIALDENGVTLLRRRVPTPSRDYIGTLNAIADLVLSAERELPHECRLSFTDLNACCRFSWPDALPKEEKVMAKFALYVPLQAKPGKEEEVADFLRSAVPLVNAEAGTTSWFAIQEGPSSFAIFDTFDDEAGRDAHLNGKGAAALMEKAEAGDLLSKRPRSTGSKFSRTSYQNKVRRCLGLCPGAVA